MSEHEDKFKVVELSTVTDETIEEVLNRMATEGYELDSSHFAMSQGSRRPSMAFLVFTRKESAHAGLS